MRRERVASESFLQVCSEEAKVTHASMPASLPSAKSTQANGKNKCLHAQTPHHHFSSVKPHTAMSGKATTRSLHTVNVQ